MNKRDSYIDSLTRLHVDRSPCGFPCFNWEPWHQAVNTKQYLLPVNSSGNLYFEICPSQLMASDNSGTPAGTTSTFLMNDPLYTDIDSTTVAATTSGYNAMFNTLRPNAGVFHSGVVIGLSMRISVTGVSTVNRKGFIYVVQYADDQIAALTSAATSQTNSYINARPLQLQLLQPVHFEQELSTSDMDALIYTWVPNFNGDTIPNYDLDIANGAINAGINDQSFDSRKCGIYLNGVDPTAKLKLEITYMYLASPLPAQLSTYPIKFGTEFQDITKKLQHLGANVDFVFKQAQDGHGHQFVTTVSNQIQNRDNFSISRVNQAVY